VHFVTSALDSGPIIVQAAVPVHPGDTEQSLSARVLVQEHRLYPQAVRWFAQGRLVTDGLTVRLAPASCEHALAAGTALVVPPLD
jgi:phosphoribosylglycinamide formyltransferase-1